jgi:hypothetical protein
MPATNIQKLLKKYKYDLCILFAFWSNMRYGSGSWEPGPARPVPGPPLGTTEYLCFQGRTGLKAASFTERN